MPQSLLFIPDISGFTEFINSTESKHSQHIVSELLEAVINANDIDLKVSEIEGDAVLFYRMGPVPSAIEIYQQAKKMYVAFHQQRAHAESHRICPCGACKTAANLTLKFIVHTGDISEGTVSGHAKLHGGPVITAHRLMKNDIDSDEYILLSGDYADQTLKPDDFDGITISKASSTYGDIGEVPYHSIMIDHFMKDVPTGTKPPIYKPSGKPIKFEQYLDHNIATVFEAISNYQYRAEPYEDIVRIEYDESKVTKSGTRHVCVIDGQADVNQEAVIGDFGDGKLVFGERLLKNPPLIKDAITFYVLEEKDGGTHISVEFYAKKVPIIGDLLFRLIGGKLKKIFAKSGREFKSFLAKNAHLIEGKEQPAAEPQSVDRVSST